MQLEDILYYSYESERKKGKKENKTKDIPDNDLNEGAKKEEDVKREERKAKKGKYAAIYVIIMLIGAVCVMASKILEEHKFSIVMVVVAAGGFSFLFWYWTVNKYYETFACELHKETKKDLNVLEKILEKYELDSAEKIEIIINIYRERIHEGGTPKIEIIQIVINSLIIVGGFLAAFSNDFSALTKVWIIFFCVAIIAEAGLVILIIKKLLNEKIGNYRLMLRKLEALRIEKWEKYKIGK